MHTIALKPGAKLTYQLADHDTDDEYVLTVEDCAKRLDFRWTGSGGAGKGTLRVAKKALLAARSFDARCFDVARFEAKGDELPPILCGRGLIEELELADAGTDKVAVRVDGKKRELGARRLASEANGLVLWVSDGEWPLVIKATGLDGTPETSIELVALQGATLSTAPKTAEKAPRAAKPAPTAALKPAATKSGPTLDETIPPPIQFARGKVPKATVLRRPTEGLVPQQSGFIGFTILDGAVYTFDKGDEALKRINKGGDSTVHKSAQIGAVLGNGAQVVFCESGSWLFRLSATGEATPLAQASVWAAYLAVDDRFVYAGSTDRPPAIERIPLDGGKPTRLPTDLKSLDGLAARDGHVAWLDRKRDVIEVLAPGARAATVVAKKLCAYGVPSGLTILDGWLYLGLGQVREPIWTSPTFARAAIVRTRLDGTSKVEIVHLAAGNLSGLTTDGRVLYWAESEGDAEVLRSVDPARTGGRVLTRFAGANSIRGLGVVGKDLYAYDGQALYQCALP